jgi:oxygen-independent coproporphyrinogen-3 oxidase
VARLPDGDPVPEDGSLPEDTSLGTDGFGVYLHIPFCASRCGYCDFNTYTPSELGGLNVEGYLEAVERELALATRIVTPSRVDTLFVGGGTPTMLSPAQLGRLLDGIDKAWGLAGEAEVTTEANPESVTPASLKELRSVGFTRISLGMQSSSPHVLRILDRQHTPGRAPQAAREARAAGFEHVNLDLIYGTPGETEQDFAESLDRAIESGVDHVSAYSLIVEDGTRLAARIRKGELPMPDDDVAADRYLLAEQKLTGAGMSWYEVSNWAMSPAHRCRHNLLYWQGGDWWGLGPGAHSHVGGVRWWNVKHPARYAALTAQSKSPGLGREILTGEERHTERLLLRLRLADGLPAVELDLAKVADGLVRVDDGRATLTLRGRLMADAVVRDLLT